MGNLKISCFKIKVWRENVHEVTNKTLQHDLNYFVDAVNNFSSKVIKT